MKLTDWYDSDANPVRKGFYECKHCVIQKYKNPRHYWDGMEWPEGAHPFMGWRGLTKPFRRNAAGDRNSTKEK